MDYRFGPFQLLTDRRLLLADGQPQVLGVRAFDLLQALVERRERIVGKAELLDLVWPDLVVEEANLPVQVSALRKLLGPDVIATVAGRGYRFVAPLQSMPTHAPGPPAAPVLGAVTPPPDRLLGRDAELAALAEWVRSRPLVTVTGAAGIGKTRLALAVVAALAPAWPDGVACVEAAPVQDPARLPQALAQVLARTLGLPPEAAPTLATVVDSLRQRRLLLLLDNGEHLLGAIGTLAQALQREAVAVHVLVTSQQPLGVAGEQLFRLRPLALPPAGERADESFGALALFAERARAVDRHFVLDDHNRDAVAAICRTLDGLPLALELAAARVRHLGVHALDERLGHSLRLLKRGPAAVGAPRHQTLHAALAWSHALLNARERAVLRRLSVFVGGCTLTLALPVLRDEGDQGDDGEEGGDEALIDALSSLVDKSCLSVEAGPPLRYGMLQTMRLFAADELAAQGETERCRQRHARVLAAYLSAAEEARWGDQGRASAATLAQAVSAEIDNARAAFDWAWQAQDWPLATTLAAGVAPQLMPLGLAGEWVPKLRALLPHLDTAPPAAQVGVLWRLGGVGLAAGMTHDELLALKQRAVACARAAGFRRRLQTTLASLGFTQARQGDSDAAQAVVAELVALDRPDDPAVVRALLTNVELMVHEQRQDAAQALACLYRQQALLEGEPDETLPLMVCQSNLVLYLNCLRRHDEAARRGLALLARPDLPRNFLHAACFTAHALAALQRPAESRRVLQPWMELLWATPIGLYSAEALIMVCLAEQRLADAVCVDAALQQHVQRSGGRLHPLTRVVRHDLQAALDAAATHAGLDPPALQRARDEGALLGNAGVVRRGLGAR